MSAIGPDLPPHLLAKRKRKQEEAAEDKPATASGAKPSSSSPDGGEKRRKVIGPAMPPAPLDERPSEPPNTTPKAAESDGDDDDDDDFGPALPSANATTTTDPEHENATNTTTSTTSPPPAAAKISRDSWMTMPPQQDDLAARMDPSKPRARGFNTGKGAKGPNALGENSSAWNETPEQKRKRLQDEMMGISQPASVSGPQVLPSGNKRKGVKDLDDEAKAQIAKSRGPSLMHNHEKSKGPDIIDDDPSTRAFDREKDMSTGMRIDGTKRKQLVGQAEGYSAKFAGGSYL